MKLLALDRSTDIQSVALAVDGTIDGQVFTGMDARSADWPLRISAFLEQHKVTLAQLDYLLVGQGPGSFAGIRAALAFAQGVALGNGVKGITTEVVGLASTYAFASEGERVAVIGDARRDRFWVVRYDGMKCSQDFTLVERANLAAAVPNGYKVLTPDGARIGDLLQEVFANQYQGTRVPYASDLARVAVANLELLQREPLPLYLQSAVRG